MAKDLIFAALVARYGSTMRPGFVREAVRIRFGELAAEAAHLVDQHLAAIESEATGRAPQRQAS
jgi:hypothetical protein